MEADKVQAKQRIWIIAFMMVIGKMIKSVGWDNSSILTRQNIMGSGKTMSGKGMGRITIQMEIGMRVIGKRICKMELEFITTPMEIFIKGNG